jgi:site-specific DNA-cytosine methylase
MTIKVLSLFSGIGGIDLAFALAGFDIVAQVEIDDYCRKVLEKHAPTYWSNAVRYGDIREVTGKQIGYVDGIVGGFPCFVAGTMVLTLEGYKPIEKLNVGEMVLTHLGNWQPITSVMSRYAEKTLTIDGMGIMETTTTHEHPYYASAMEMRYVSRKIGKRRHFEDKKWIDAKDLTNNHFLTQVLPQATIAETETDAFWWLVGRYLADGWRVQRKGRANAGRVVICASHDEAEELANAIVSAGLHATLVKERTVVKYHIVKNDFYQFLEQFGHKADGKTLPGWCLQLPQQKASCLLEGYLSGDGSLYKNKSGNVGGKRFTTVSKSLALGMALLGQKAFGIVASVYEHNVPETTVIEGRAVNQKAQFSVSFADKQRSAFIEGNYGYKKIRTITETNGDTVYNISVGTDESYIANGAIVHNCQDISIAGNGLGLQGARSGLWYEFARLISEIRPRFVMLENVPAITHRGGLDVIGNLTALGYDCQWGIVSASDAGAPHKRERWFCVGYANSNTARKPRRNIVHYSQRNTTRYLQKRELACGVRSKRQIHGKSETMGNAPRQTTIKNVWRIIKCASQLSDSNGARKQQTVSQSQLGRDAHGLSARLDITGHTFPNPPNMAQKDSEPSRLTDIRKGRKDRIKALGNAVVPQVVYPIAQAIMKRLTD